MDGFYLHDVIALLQNTLNQIDPRLVDHGKRVAFLAVHMLRTQGGYAQKQIQDMAMLALLHDVGAYKTDEIDRMLRFETVDVWEHSIYGYLFLRDLSPLREQAEVVLYHHLRYDWQREMDARYAMLSQILSIADRVDVFQEHMQGGEQLLHAYLAKSRGGAFAPEAVDLFWKAEGEHGLLRRLREPVALCEAAGDRLLPGAEAAAYLKMMSFAIDCRSPHTVTHTITTIQISVALSRLLAQDETAQRQVYYGALLHDLGKIGIPARILEYPGKLSPEDMAVMRTHVALTGKILDGRLTPEITRIALRHHEKLDGSGYPEGLRAEALTLSERIVAVADIVSALCGTRSYKEAFPKEKTLGILSAQARDGLLDAQVVAVVTRHFDSIMDEVRRECAPLLTIYSRMHSEYADIMQRFTEPVKDREAE